MTLLLNNLQKEALPVFIREAFQVCKADFMPSRSSCWLRDGGPALCWLCPIYSASIGKVGGSSAGRAGAVSSQNKPQIPVLRDQTVGEGPTQCRHWFYGSCSLVDSVSPALLREEVAQLQEEVHLLRQMKEMLTKELEETHGSKSPEVLSATELKVQLAQKEQELARAKEALQGKGCLSL